MSQFIIKDWAGNHLFTDKVFNNAEAGAEFLIEKFPNDEDIQEYFVTPLNK